MYQSILSEICSLLCSKFIVDRARCYYRGFAVIVSNIRKRCLFGTYNLFERGRPYGLMPALEYSETLFSKKFVLPCKDINSMKSKGLVALYILLWRKETNRRSATNSIYWHIKDAFIPISLHGRAARVHWRWG